MLPYSTNLPEHFHQICRTPAVPCNQRLQPVSVAQVRRSKLIQFPVSDLTLQTA
jgi:hypothetical protein